MAGPIRNLIGMWRGFRLQRQIAIATLLVSALLAGVAVTMTTLLTEAHTNAALETNHERVANLLVPTVVSALLFGQDEKAALEELLANDTELLALALYGPDDTLVAYRGSQELVEQLSPLSPHPSDTTVVEKSTDHWVTVAPLVAAPVETNPLFATAVSSEPEILGHLYIASSRDRANALVRSSVNSQLIAIGIASLLLVVLVYLLVGRMVRPMTRLMADIEHDLNRRSGVDEGKSLDREDARTSWETRKLDQIYEAKRHADLISQQKSKFFAGISHDLRVPLHVIGGCSDELLEFCKNPESVNPDDLQEVSSDIRYQALELMELIDAILDLQKIEAGEHLASPQHFDAFSALEKATQGNRYMASEKGLDLSIDGPSPFWVNQDEFMLKRVIRNLVSNAVKFTNKGEIQIRFTPPGDSDDRWTIVVSDTGPGIPSEYIDSIFAPWDRGGDELLQLKEGSGLGLAVVAEFVQRMGGAVEVVSEPGNTVFTVTLPGFLQDQ